MLTLNNIPESKTESVMSVLIKQLVQKQEDILMLALKGVLQREPAIEDISECSLINFQYNQNACFFYKDFLLGTLIRKSEYNNESHCYTFIIKFNPANNSL